MVMARHGGEGTRRVVMLLAKEYSVDPRVQNEARSLKAEGYDVTVLSWDRSGGGDGKGADGVRVVGLRLLNGTLFSKLAFAISALVLQLYSVAWCLRNLRGPYFVHANDFNTLPAGVALKALRPGAVRLIYDCHELTPSAYAEWFGAGTGLVAGALERRLIPFADAVITVSPPIRSYLSDASDRPVSVIFNTIGTESVPPEEKEALKRKLGLKGFVVSYVGSLRQDVGLEEFMAAARRFAEAGRGGIEFVIVGSGPDLQSMKARAADLDGAVRFVPRLPHAEALEYVKASDVSYAVYRVRRTPRASVEHEMLVQGNTLVASPWKVFEAMACGTCVLVRGGTYTWSLANDLGFGISAGTGTEAEVTTGLSWALENKGRVGEMAKAARAHFVEEYNWDEMAKELARVYRTAGRAGAPKGRRDQR